MNYKSANHSNQYHIVRSKRKTIAILVREDGSVEVRAPFFVSNAQILRFIESKQSWIAKKQAEALQRLAATPVLTPQQEELVRRTEKKLRTAAKNYIPYRVEHFHQLTGGHYTKISIRDQKSRWGSCSSSGSLSFNYRLMMAPASVLDYVVVHELCHLTHLNHSKQFWNMVESILPDYRTCEKWLKEHGQELTVVNYLFSSR